MNCGRWSKKKSQKLVNVVCEWHLLVKAMEVQMDKCPNENNSTHQEVRKVLSIQVSPANRNMLEPVEKVISTMKEVNLFHDHEM